MISASRSVKTKVEAIPSSSSSHSSRGDGEPFGEGFGSTVRVRVTSTRQPKPFSTRPTTVCEFEVFW